MLGYFALKRSKACRSYLKVDISLGFFSFSMVYRSFWFRSFMVYRDVNRFSMNSFKHSLLFSLEESSPLTILTGTSAPIPYFLLLYGSDWHTFSDFSKVIVFALRAFAFLCKWLLYVLMQFSISFYSLIFLGVPLEYGNWEQNHSLHQNS